MTAKGVRTSRCCSSTCLSHSSTSSLGLASSMSGSNARKPRLIPLVSSTMVPRMSKTITSMSGCELTRSAPRYRYRQCRCAADRVRRPVPPRRERTDRRRGSRQDPGVGQRRVDVTPWSARGGRTHLHPGAGTTGSRERNGWRSPPVESESGLLKDRWRADGVARTLRPRHRRASESG